MTRIRTTLLSAAQLGVLLSLTISIAAGQRPPGGFVPGQKRPPGDPVQIARGKTLFGINCRGCHGADLRGGDLGGPNLLRSQVALSDLDGELIVPIIMGSRQSQGMPAIPVSPDDAKAIATYVRSVMATIGVQGKPPTDGQVVLNVIVGNANEGKAFFAAKCASCHSASGDLKDIATKIPEAKTLQSTWIAGGGRGSHRPPASASVTLPSGEVVEGQLLRIDDFMVSLKLANGAFRTFRRDGDTPKVTVRDPMQGHRALLSEYTDKDMHDVTAYLATLK